MDTDLQTELNKIQGIYESGFITEYEYNRRRKELLGDNYTTTTTSVTTTTTITSFNNDDFYNQNIPILDFNGNNVNNSYNNSYNSSNNSYDYNYVQPVTSTYDHNNNTSYNHDNNYNTSSSYDYNQVQPVSNTFNDYSQPQVKESTPSYDYYNQVQPINNNNSTPSYDYYNQVDNHVEVPSTPPSEYNQNDVSYDYNQHHHVEAPLTPPSEYKQNNVSTYIKPPITDDDIYVPLRVIPDKPLITTSKVVKDRLTSASETKKSIEYPHKVKDSYMTYKDDINGIILYYKSKECNYQSDIIPIEGLTMRRIMDIVKEQYGINQFDLKRLILKHRTVSDYIYMTDSTEQTLEDVCEIVPGHYLIQPATFVLHRNAGTLRITGEYGGVYNRDFVPIPRHTIYQFDQVYHSKAIPLDFPETNQTWSTPYFYSVPTKGYDFSSKGSKYTEPCIKPRINDNWLKINFITLLRNRQASFIMANNSNNGQKSLDNLSPLTKISDLMILEYIQQCSKESKCIHCSSMAYVQFLCSTHYDNDFIKEYEKVKHLLIKDKEVKEIPIREAPQDNLKEMNQEELKSKQKLQDENNKVHRSYEKFKYVDQNDILNYFNKTKKPSSYFD